MKLDPLSLPLRNDLKRSDLLNKVAETIGAKSYLEIGVQTGKTLFGVNVEEKTGVDPDPTSRATLVMTSDFFFDLVEEDRKFDLIYVDGLHEWQTALRDIKNAVRHLSEGGVIVVDDIAPKRENHQTRTPTSPDLQWTGDVWIAWLIACVDLADEFDLFSVDLAFGQGLIVPKKYKVSDDVVSLDQVPEFADWNWYVKNRGELHKMISFEEFKALEWTN